MQNNAWITSRSHGLHIIGSDGIIWSNNNSNAIDFENYNLLSNSIYDIAFDQFGNVFVATELGISILETSFAQNQPSQNISVSPNPFKIGEDYELTITNIPKNSIIKIMNLSGIVLKEFIFSQNDRTFNWEGTDSRG